MQPSVAMRVLPPTMTFPRTAPLHQRAMWRPYSQIDQLPAELTVLPDVEILVKAGAAP